MNYVAIFHANLNYAFLEPHKYERTIRASYETIIDTFAKKFPKQKYVFEASGYTIEQMAKRTPDVIRKLRAAVDRGQCEFMGSPYSHPIMANIPAEDGYWSNYFAMKTYDKYLGFRPESAWNPECTWMQYVPTAFRKAGYKYLTLDFESYMICNDVRYGWVERTRAHDIGWGGNLPWYELDPDCKFLHRPFRDVVPGLHGMCRSDRLIGGYVGYFLGRIPLEDYMGRIKKWTGSKGQGATIIIADDAEYTGTTGYFYVKYYRDYSRSFEVDPKAGEKLEKLVVAVQELGDLITFKEACEMEPVEEPFFVEDRFAWHRTYADAWAGTPEARAWEPVLHKLRTEYKKYQPLVESKPKYRRLAEKFWFHLTNSANSDGRWPPPPAETCPFNREWVLDEMAAAKTALAEIKRAVKGVSLPKRDESYGATMGETWEYGFHYTDKSTDDIRKLNYYELEHHLYSCFRLFDEARDPALKEKGRKAVNAVFEEFERRGGNDSVHRRV